MTVAIYVAIINRKFCNRVNSRPVRNTIDVEIFIALNVRGFNPIKVFVEILLRCVALAKSAYYFV